MDIKKEITKNKNIISTTTGNITSYVLKDPTGLSGTIIKMAMDKLLTVLVNDVENRMLSELEKQKVADVLKYAVDDISKKLREGKKIRNDGFFSTSTDDKADAQEIFESIIIEAQREYENKKLQYYGKLLSNISFESNISKPIGIQLISLASKLTYRQYMLLSIIYQQSCIKNKIPFLINKELASQEINFEKISVYQDMYELYRNGLINGGGKIIMETGYINPSELRIQGIGVRLYELMELANICLENSNDYIELLNIIKHPNCNLKK